jgi:energy-converting hydrogenase B subunit D
MTLATLFLVMMLICAVAVLAVQDLLAAVVLFGAFSFFSAILFSVFGALDVAFTEAVVGGALTTVFFVTAIYRTARRARR